MRDSFHFRGTLPLVFLALLPIILLYGFCGFILSAGGHSVTRLLAPAHADRCQVIFFALRSSGQKCLAESTEPSLKAVLIKVQKRKMPKNLFGLIFRSIFVPFVLVGRRAAT